MGSSSNLVYNDGLLELIYTGASCQGTTPFTTYIVFACSSLENEVRLLADGASACVKTFQWLTPLVCETLGPAVKCEVYANNMLYDLSSLVNNQVRSYCIHAYIYIRLDKHACIFQSPFIRASTHSLPMHYHTATYSYTHIETYKHAYIQT